MNGYIGFLNLNMNTYEEKQKKTMIKLQDLYRSIDIKSMKNTDKESYIENMTILKVTSCKTSRGCTPKADQHENEKLKHKNYMTEYKNAQTRIRTNLSGYAKNYVMINVYGTVTMGGVKQDIYLRIPKSGVVGVRLGLSIQNIINVSDKDADRKIDKLINDVIKMVNKMIPQIKTNRRTKLNAMSVHGFNASDPTGGKKPEFRVKNFIEFIHKLDKHLPNHNLDYEPSEQKAVRRGNYKPIEGKSDTTIGITQWLTCDFLGVKRIREVQKLSAIIYDGYRKVKKDIKNDLEAEAPKSRRKKGVKMENVDETYNKLKWNNNRQVLIRKGKPKKCMELPKPYLKSVAKQLQVNPDGFKKDLCPRIMAKVNKLEKYTEVNNSDVNQNIPRWNNNRQNVYMGKYKLKCMTKTKDVLIEISSKLGLKTEGTRKQLCERIEKKLRPQQNKTPESVKIPKWNPNKQKFYIGKKTFTCMGKSKGEIIKLAEKLGLDTTGKREQICDRIKNELK